MQLDVYVNYRGTCEEAFNFYAQHLGGKISMCVRHGETPFANRFAMLRDRFGTSWLLLHEPEAA